MSMLIWIILLASYVSADPSALGEAECMGDFCISLSEGVITAEAGLCAVIQCFYNIPWNFYPTSLVWFKCAGQTCNNNDTIFHSINNNKIQSSFSGRVALLKSDLSQGNCSIIISDLRLSDSGTYYFSVNNDNERFLFSFHSATITVKALQQKPTVLSPALTEGQRASLTCIAPGLCSGSEPTFTWTWRGAGEVPNITTATTDRLTHVSHRHSSTLELTPSAELHGAELSCTVSYKSSSTQDSVRINVTYVKDIEVIGDTVVKEGDFLNVTCSVDSFPPSSVTMRKRGAEATKQTETHKYKTGSASLVILNVTKENEGVYECTAQHELKNQTTHLEVKVLSAREGGQCAPVPVVLLSAVIVCLILNFVFIVIILFLRSMRTKKLSQEERVIFLSQKRKASSLSDINA